MDCSFLLHIIQGETQPETGVQAETSSGERGELQQGKSRLDCGFHHCPRAGMKAWLWSPTHSTGTHSFSLEDQLVDAVTTHTHTHIPALAHMMEQCRKSTTPFKQVIPDPSQLPTPSPAPHGSEPRPPHTLAIFPPVKLAKRFRESVSTLEDLWIVNRLDAGTIFLHLATDER